MQTDPKKTPTAAHCLCLVVLLLLGSLPGFGRDKYETIDATAYGTSTPTRREYRGDGHHLRVLDARGPSDTGRGVPKGPEPRTRSRAGEGEGGWPHPDSGNTFIRLIQAPTGRTIRFVTNRKIAFGEAYYNTQSQSFDLTRRDSA